jgi:hypothetical protein
MNPPQQPGASGFYKGMAVVFLLLGGVFVWAAISHHSWFYGAFAIITIINALMSMLRSAVGATKP